MKIGIKKDYPYLQNSKQVSKIAEIFQKDDTCATRPLNLINWEKVYINTVKMSAS